jgi:hypothetical protein
MSFNETGIVAWTFTVEDSSDIEVLPSHAYSVPVKSGARLLSPQRLFSKNTDDVKGDECYFSINLNGNAATSTPYDAHSGIRITYVYNAKKRTYRQSRNSGRRQSKPYCGSETHTPRVALQVWPSRFIFLAVCLSPCTICFQEIRYIR